MSNALAFPTMITPYRRDGSVDLDAAAALVTWYREKGLDGIFAVCQSSEIFFLTEDERVSLAHLVIQKEKELQAADPGKKHMTIVASGHVSDRFEDQVRELNRIAAEGPDALIWITNRLDIADTDDAHWIADAEKLLAQMPEDMPLGLYECPYPYKRLLTPAMLEWCRDTGRFRFIKDTCCDAALIRERLSLLSGSGLGLYNANAQTLLETLKDGAAGYCGVMANFHPQLYVKLTHDFEKDPAKASLLQDFLCLAAFTESLTYPVCAKYHLSSIEKIPMEITSRSRDCSDFTPYQAACIRQMDELAKKMGSLLA